MAATEATAWGYIASTFGTIAVSVPDAVGIAFAAAGVAAGVAVPFAGRAMLSMKLKESDGFFDRRLREYMEFERDHNRAPSMVGQPDEYERDLCAWMVYVKKKAADGQLDADQTRRLADAGVLSGDAERFEMLVERSKPAGSRKETFNLAVKPWMCVVSALVGGAAMLAAACVGASIPSLLLMLALLVCVGTCMVVDCKAYIIPYQLSYAAYPLALAFAVSACWPDWHGVAFGALAALVVSLVFVVCNKLLKMRGNIMGVGGGDMRLLPAIAIAGCGFGSGAGFVAMVAVMGVTAVFAVAFGGKGMKSYLPMAPGLLTWLAAGCVVAAGLGAAM